MSKPYEPTSEELGRFIMSNMLILLRCKAELKLREKYPPRTVELRDGRRVTVYDATYRFTGIMWHKARGSDTYEAHARLEKVNGSGPPIRMPNVRALLMDAESIILEEQVLVGWPNE